MDLFDTMALLGRRYVRRHASRSGSERFTLSEVLEMFDRQAIFELTPYVGSKPLATLKPDFERKLKVSLLDGISEIKAAPEDWFEVLQTAPTGDLSKVKLVAHSPAGTTSGELKMLVGGRTIDHYFREDPILREIK